MKDRKNLVALICAAVVMGMTGAAFAAVPLYRLFCQVTGFDGTAKKAEAAALATVERADPALPAPAPVEGAPVSEPAQ